MLTHCLQNLGRLYKKEPDRSTSFSISVYAEDLRRGKKYTTKNDYLAQQSMIYMLLITCAPAPHHYQVRYYYYGDHWFSSWTKNLCSMLHL